ncbi:MAG: hypothetical protein KF819_18180 [Labilithrix sp.]|nr:hypothetical protein [Labilithrix sp.]
MIIVYGTRFYGHTDKVEGVGHVACRFVHIMFVPLIPIETMFLLGDDRGVKLPFSMKAALCGWLRGGTLLWGISSLIGGVVEMAEGEILYGGVLVVGAVIAFVSFFLVGLLFGKCSDARKRELMSALGVDPGDLGMHAHAPAPAGPMPMPYPHAGPPPAGGFGQPQPYGAPPSFGPPQQQPGYGAPQQQPGFGAPPQAAYGAPPSFGPPQQQPGYGPPPQAGYGAPAQPAYGAPPQPGYGAPPPAAPAYGAPPGYGAPPQPPQPPHGFAPQGPPPGYGGPPWNRG